MNKIENLKSVITEIFEQEGPKYYYTPSEVNRLLHGLNYTKLFSALADRYQCLYAFCSIGIDGDSHQYYSSKLVPQNATLIWRGEPEPVSGSDDSCYYCHEMWLLEDMSVIVTSCFRTIHEDDLFASEYREIKGDEWPSYLIPLNILELWEFLRDLCVPGDEDDEEEFSPTIMYEP